MRSIPYGKQFIDKYDKKSVLEALSSQVLTTGNQVLKFEYTLIGICVFPFLN